MPSIAASYPVDRSDFVPVAYDGRVGVWISEDGLANMLIGFEQENGALRVEGAVARVGEKLATERADAIERNAKKMAWRAEYGSWLGFVGGVVLSVAVTLGAVYAGRALSLGLPTQ